MKEGYKNASPHGAVFVKFPLLGRPQTHGTGDRETMPDENLLVWTTTPWTLTSNVGAAVNPKLTYLKVKHKDEIYYVAKGAFTTARREEDFKRGEWVDGVPQLQAASHSIFKEKGGYEIVGEVQGEEMLGWQYDGPFDDLPAQHSRLRLPRRSGPRRRRS